MKKFAAAFMMLALTFILIPLFSMDANAESFLSDGSNLVSRDAAESNAVYQAAYKYEGDKTFSMTLYFSNDPYASVDYNTSNYYQVCIKDSTKGKTVCSTLVKKSDGNTYTVSGLVPEHTYKYYVLDSYYWQDDDNTVEEGAVTMPYVWQYLCGDGTDEQTETWIFDAGTGILSVSTTSTGYRLEYKRDDYDWVKYSSKITTLRIEDSIDYIFGGFFDELTNLKKLVFEGTNPQMYNAFEISETNGTDTGIYVKDLKTWFSRMDRAKADVIYGNDNYYPLNKLHNLYVANKDGTYTLLTSVTIPSGMKAVPAYAFNGCTSLKSVTIPSGVTTIGDGAFSGCTNLSELSISKSVKEIRDYAFRGCTKLSNLTIPASVSFIGVDAFAKCSGLKSLEFLGSKIVLTRNSKFSYNLPSKVVIYGKHGSDIEELAYLNGWTFRVKNGVSLSQKYFTYDGKAKKPSVKVLDSKGNVIASSQYTVSYPSGRKAIGEYTVVVKFKNGGSKKTAKFYIIPVGTKFTSVKNGKLKWAKKTKYISGYQIESDPVSFFVDIPDINYSKPYMTKKFTIKSSTKTSYTINKKDLDEDCNYYVRIRTYYRTAKGKTYYSRWSGWKYSFSLVSEYD